MFEKPVERDYTISKPTLKGRHMNISLKQIGTLKLDQILTDKNIPHWTDLWGTDVAHDWCWWQKQFPYFLDRILGPA